MENQNCLEKAGGRHPQKVGVKTVLRKKGGLLQGKINLLTCKKAELGKTYREETGGGGDRVGEGRGVQREETAG